MLLTKVDFYLIPEKDVILPVPSSKILKQMILNKEILPSLAEILASKDKNKPIFLSFVGIGNKRLIIDGKPLTVKGGTRLNASVSFLFYKKFPEEISEGAFNTTYGNFLLKVDNIHVIDLYKINKMINDKMDKNVKIEFVTPALLSSKVLLPPSLKPKYDKLNVGYSLLPSVGLIIASAYKIYHSVLGKSNNQEYENRTFRLGVLSNALSRVIGYKLTPITVLVGRDEKGRLRKTRGTIGWIEFDILNEKLKRNALKYLIIASILGIGKSRGIGFGETKIEIVDKEKKQK